jgi:RimJ/RimL family protein N-acetyltransferase
VKGGPAYVVLTPRLRLRCWEPADAPALLEAIRESVEHLRPWLPWAHAEPQSLDEKAALLRRFRADFDSDRDFVYGIFERDDGRALGSTGLHPRVGPGGMEIGYWIRASATGRGYASEAAGALTRVALEVLNVDRVEIHCDPANGPSAAVPHKLGFRHEATLRRRTRDEAGRLRDSMVWTMLREELAGSPADTLAIQAFDVLGRPVL